MGHFCDYMTRDCSLCGVWVSDEHKRCDRHKNKKDAVIRDKIGKYSGDSSYRQETGNYQAKKGR